MQRIFFGLSFLILLVYFVVLLSIYWQCLSSSCQSFFFSLFISFLLFLSVITLSLHLWIISYQKTKVIFILQFFDIKTTSDYWLYVDWDVEWIYVFSIFYILSHKQKNTHTQLTHLLTYLLTHSLTHQLLNPLWLNSIVIRRFSFLNILYRCARGTITIIWTLR